MPHVRKPLEEQLCPFGRVLIAQHLLPLVNPGSGERWITHAIANEQDDVLGDVGVLPCPLQGVGDLVFSIVDPEIGI